jgi:O-antigen ligase
MMGLVLLACVVLVVAQGVVWPLAVLLPLEVALYPFARYPAGSGLVTFDRVWALAVGAAALLASRRVNSDASSRQLRISGMCFIVVVAMRVAFGGDIAGPGQTVVDALVLPAIVYLAVSRVAVSAATRRTLAASAALAGCLCAAIGIAEAVVGFELASRSGGAVRYDFDAGGVIRVSGPYPVPEVYALLLVVTLAATLYWVQSRSRRFTILTIAAVAIQSAGLILSLFRVAWIALLLVLMISVGLRPGRTLRRFVVVLTVAAVVALAALPFRGNEIFQRRVGNTRNVAGRFATYQVGLEIFKDAPIAGIGLNRFALAQREYTPRSVQGIRSVTSPHSSFLAVLAEVGVIGAGALAWLAWAIARMVRAAWRRARDDEQAACAAACLGASVGYLLFSLTLTMIPYGPSNLAFAFILGLASGVLGSGRADDGIRDGLAQEQTGTNS